MLKRVINLLFLLMIPALAGAQLTPTGTHSWHDSTRNVDIGAMGSSRPLNYQKDEDGTWDFIVPAWVQHNDSVWKVVRGFHRTYACTDGRAYYVIPRGGVRHAIGTKPYGLIKINKSDTTWELIASPNYDSMVVDSAEITFYDIFPGINRVLQYDNSFYSERYVFTQAGRDWLATQGPWGNRMIGTATRLDIDSLNLNIRDKDGEINWSVAGKIIDGWIKGVKGDTAMFYIQTAEIIQNWQSTGIVVRKWIVLIGDTPYLIELFDAVSAGNLPDGEFWHNETFGSETEGGSTVGLEWRVVQLQATPASDGTADSLNAYINMSNASADQIRGAIYVRNDTSMVDTTYEESYGYSGSAWHIFEFVDPPEIYSTTEYLLCLWGDDASSYIHYQSGDSSQYIYGYDYGNQWPDPLPTSLRGTLEYSIYCFYTAGGQPPEGKATIMRTVIQ